MMPSASNVLRIARDTDYETIADIWRSAWASANPDAARLEPPAHWRKRVRTEFAPPLLTLVHETADGVIQAFMVLDTSDAYLHQLFVHPGAQRHGLGAELLTQVCTLCPNGWTLHVANSNRGARQFYARFGLVEGLIDRNPSTGRERVRYIWQPRQAQ